MMKLKKNKKHIKGSNKKITNMKKTPTLKQTQLEDYPEILNNQCEFQERRVNMKKRKRKRKILSVTIH